jgi:diacylglycerol kinase family enzyme
VIVRAAARVGFAAVRVVLIVNPAASSVTTRARVSLERLLSASHDLTVRETLHRGHATALAREAAVEGADAVFALGGDGTLNETADGLAGSTTALAVLPGGSTNVFARAIGVDDDPVTAGRRLVAALEEGAVRRVGLGAVRAPGQDWRRFVFHLGIGFDAAVIRRMEQRSYLKRHFAHPAFALAASATWLRHYDRRTAIRVRAGDDTAGVTAEGPYVVVSNADPYTYVGHRRMTISPYASLDDTLAVTVLHHLRLPLVVGAVGSSIGGGRFLATSTDVTQIGHVRTLTVTAHRPFPWQVDGDYLGEVERLDVRHEPDCLSLVRP